MQNSGDKMKSTLEKNAEKLFSIFNATPKELRGDLLCEAGELLKESAQHFTGDLLIRAGHVYGESEVKELTGASIL